MTTAVIVAAGSSRRMGFDKLTAPLGEHTVLHHSILACHQCPEVSAIVVVTDEERFEDVETAAFSKPIIRTDGGLNRQDSVQHGLAVVSGETWFVAVHDGARPLVTPEAISLAISATAETGAATLARPLTETLKRSEEGFAKESLSRENLWAMETPQCFRVGLLREAYEKVAAEHLTVTDEVSALQSLGIKVKLVANPSLNPKITYPSDLPLANAILKARESESG